MISSMLSAMVFLVGTSAADPVAPEAVPVAMQQVEVTLVDGQVLRAEMPASELSTWKTGASVTVVLHGVPITLDAALVASIRGLTVRPPEEERPVVRTAASRYLFAPSAIPLEKGRGYVSQKELIFTFLAYGVTDHVTVEAATSVPLLLFGFSQLDTPDITSMVMMGLVGAKVAGQVSPGFYASAGGEVFVNQSAQLALPYASVTVGGPTAHASLAGGYLFVKDLFDQWNASTDSPLVVPITLSGFKLVQPHWGLISENWLCVIDDHVVGLVTAGARILPEKGTWSIDAALAGYALQDQVGFVPVPWLDVTWNFDARKGKP
jgi:hypothetical protein